MINSAAFSIFLTSVQLNDIFNETSFVFCQDIVDFGNNSAENMKGLITLIFSLKILSNINEILHCVHLFEFFRK